MVDGRNRDLEIYKVISSQNGGINVSRISNLMRCDAYDVRRVLSSSPLIKELCYRNSKGQYSTLISGQYPHYGLDHFSCYYSSVEVFLNLPEKAFMEKLEKERADRLISSAVSSVNRKNARLARCSLLGMFTDLRLREEIQRNLLTDAQKNVGSGSESVSERMKSWEIVFYPEINVSGGTLHCACDVLLITENYVFAFNFLSASQFSDRNLLKLYTLSGDFSTIFGSEYRVVAAPVLTNGSGQVSDRKIVDLKKNTSVELSVCSRDRMYTFLDLQLL